MAIQACIDLAARIISLNRWPAPAGYHGIFDRLQEKGLLISDVANPMKAMVGFRNALVHEYREIHNEAVFQNLKDGPPRIEAFLSAIRRVIG